MKLRELLELRETRAGTKIRFDDGTNGIVICRSGIDDEYVVNGRAVVLLGSCEIAMGYLDSDAYVVDDVIVRGKKLKIQRIIEK